ncbi:hypothetical protein D3C76_1360950 [compost metagenome]
MPPTEMTIYEPSVLTGNFRFDSQQFPCTVVFIILHLGYISSERFLNRCLGQNSQTLIVFNKSNVYRYIRPVVLGMKLFTKDISIIIRFDDRILYGFMIVSQFRSR